MQSVPTDLPCPYARSKKSLSKNTLPAGYTNTPRRGTMMMSEGQREVQAHQVEAGISVAVSRAR